MSFLLALVIFGGWFLAAAVTAVAVGACLWSNPEKEPWWVKAADDWDRQRLIALAERARDDEYWDKVSRLAWEREMARMMRSVR